MLDRIILFPYYLVLKFRDLRYHNGGKEAEVPTICIGNVTVGGTGKTPHTEMVLSMLSTLERWSGRHVAVLSRGYRRSSRGFRLVPSGGSAALYGDEPVQIKNKFPDVTVAVDKDRVEGCRLLAHPEQAPAADIVVLDDAFQYRKLKASLNVVLVDYNRPVGKDRLLPVGSLRDLPERISEADVIIVTKCPSELEDEEKTEFTRSLYVKDFNPETCEAESTEKKGRVQKIFFTTICYNRLKPVFPEGDARYIYSKKVILFTGIARNAPMVSHLSDSYSIVRKLTFGDHHKYSCSDFDFLEHIVLDNPTAAVITTEKDAQRVLDSSNVPSALKERMFMIPIEPAFLSKKEEKMFGEILSKLS